MPAPTNTEAHPLAGPRLTERDEAALRWLAEMGGVRVDLLAHLLTLLSDREDRTPVGARRVRQMVERWHTLGLVEVAHIGHGEPRWVWPTRRALAHLDTGGLAYREPRVSQRHHTHALAAVRIHLAHAQPEATWTPERVLAAEHGRVQPGEHRPDAVLDLPGGQRIAIEVETSQKARRRWHEVWGTLFAATLDLGDASRGFDAAWYFAPDWLRPRLAAALEDVPHLRERIRLVDLGTYSTPSVVVPEVRR